jgi:hypothetical protein
MNHTNALIICALCAASSFAAKADALTFSYGGQQGAKLYSNDNSTVLQSWSKVSGPYSAHLSDSGTVWYTSGSGSAVTNCQSAAGWSSIYELDWNGNGIDTITATELGGGMGHHAITITDNGTILAIMQEYYNSKCGERIVEYNPETKAILWQWHTGDHEGSGATKLQRGSSSQDPYHMNNVDLDTASDKIVFSAHNVLEVMVIDHSTTSSDILWRIGKPANYGGSSSNQFIAYAVHSARWVKPGVTGAGNIVFYANQGYQNSSYATGYEVAPTYSLGSNGEWPYSVVFKGDNASSKTTNTGGMDKLFNGNWLVTFSNESSTAYEFDATNGSSQTKSQAVGSWSSGGSNGLRRYPVCGGILAAGVAKSDAEAIALYNSACATSSSSSDAGTSSSSSSSAASGTSSSSSDDGTSSSSSSADSGTSSSSSDGGTTLTMSTVGSSSIQMKIANGRLQLHGLEANSWISIFDASGNTKYQGRIQNAGSLAVSTAGWPRGAYFVNIYGNGWKLNRAVGIIR